MEVLILSKTKYGPTQFCVGGICLDNNQFIRLLRPGGYYQPEDTPFQVGDIWDITFTINSYREEPHNEDTTVHSQEFVRKVYKLETFIKNSGVSIWRDHITNIYEGKILWTYGGKGYFSEKYKKYPKNSVGFWISDVDLIYNSNNQEYTYTNNGKKYAIKFKGNVVPIPVIPRGKLIRLSLAKWWKPDDSDIEERCYLQLSGWYDDLPEPVVSEPISRIRPTISKPIVSEPISRTRPTANKNTSGSCYIATLCYEDYYAYEVCRFRDFRDNTLKKSNLGRLFVKKYYQFAPKLTAKLEGKTFVNKTIKYFFLNPLLKFITYFKI